MKTPLIRNVKASLFEHQVRLAYRNEVRYLEGALVAEIRRHFVRRMAKIAAATFHDSNPRWKQRQKGPVYLVVGVNHGAIVIPENLKDVKFGSAHTQFCAAYALKLGLSVGKVRWLQFHSFNI